MSSAVKIFRLAILISGRGSNMAALIAATQSGKIAHSEVAVVISDQTSAPGLQRAKDCGIETLIIERSGRSREEHDREMVAALRAREIDLICLAGYMKILSRDFIDAYRGRILNIHPSLLPSFAGLEAQKQALAHGVKVAGCTVHFVDETLDGGPIVAQRVVPVRPDDTVESLSERILQQEHELYPEAVATVLARVQATQAANS
jgi:phosphoribosylglycinamide formyltransferase 1